MRDNGRVQVGKAASLLAERLNTIGSYLYQVYRKVITGFFGKKLRNFQENGKIYLLKVLAI